MPNINILNLPYSDSEYEEEQKVDINLDFSRKEEETPMQGKNILNLPYSDSEDEEEQEVDLKNQVATEHEYFPSPTPREGQGEPVPEASSRKPRS